MSEQKYTTGYVQESVNYYFPQILLPFISRRLSVSILFGVENRRPIQEYREFHEVSVLSGRVIL
jgi:hypothetical protein